MIKSNFASKKPQLIKEWHPTKNGALSPFDVSAYSKDIVWWKCAKGDDHEWQAIISNRTQGKGCPICSGKKIVTSNCLATVNPQLAHEWHPTKNGTLTPQDVVPGSHRKAWWRCQVNNDHEWDAAISKRTRGNGCPICSGKRVSDSNCLSTINPALANEWHPTKNGTLTPRDVVASSHKKVWWKCPISGDHEWQTMVSNRSQGAGCPICAGLKVVRSNCFATLYPELAKEWHPSKNEALTPYDVTPFSDKVAWWQCPKSTDHVWQAAVEDRNNGTGCPICSNKKVVKSNSLATLNPKLAGEWHPTKNGVLTPDKVTPGSLKKAWWVCPKGNDHFWRASVISRSKGHGCGVCASQVVVHSNCLATLNPKLTEEWHPTKNGILTPYKVTPSSGKKVWWKCPKGDDHEWDAIIANRNKGISCPICSNQKLSISNCLRVANPKLAKEWHPTKNGKLTPFDVLPSANKMIWWKCPIGDDHEWKAKLNNRASGRGCPICAGQKLAVSNCLATRYPDVAVLWHPTKNGKLSPYDVLPGTAKRVWWKCPKGDDHEWEATINSRTGGTGCPKCNPAYSIPELRIFCELSAIFENVQHRVIINKREVDIYIPELNIGIEFDGVYWHQDKHEKDQKKYLALTASICLIRIREEGLPLLSANDIPVKKREMTISTIKEILNKILKINDSITPIILEKINRYMAEDDWIATSHFHNYFSKRKHVDFKKSLNYLFPALANEWHSSKNDQLLPELFTPGSGRVIWWKGDCGHEWQDSILHRTQGRNCPKCRYKRASNSRRKKMQENSGQLSMGSVFI